MKESIFLNGNYIPAQEGCLSVDDPGFLYGWGVFETFRSREGNTVYLEAHLDRLHGSCRLLDISLAYSSQRLKSIIYTLLKENALRDARLRISAWKRRNGCGVLVTARSYHPPAKQVYRNGYRLCVSALRQDSASFFARIKSMNRLFYELCYDQAKASGCDEALILNSRGHIAECSRANIFFVKDGELFTPALRCGCLNGITRMAVLDLAEKYGRRVFEGSFTFRELEKADEVFLTNAMVGIMPIRYVEGVKIGRSVSTMTAFLSEKYSDLCRLKR